MERIIEKTCIICGEKFNVVVGNMRPVIYDCEDCPGGKRTEMEEVVDNDAEYCSMECVKEAIRNVPRI